MNSYFDNTRMATEDTFAARRTGGEESYGNPYDPESLMIGSEDQQGLTPYDKRHWPSREVYQDAVAGRLTPEEIVKIAPRVKGNRTVSFETDNIAASYALDLV